MVINNNMMPSSHDAPVIFKDPAHSPPLGLGLTCPNAVHPYSGLFCSF